MLRILIDDYNLYRENWCPPTFRGVSSGIGKASANPAALQDPQTHSTLKPVVGCLRLCSILLIEGSILDPCYEI
jgi:hypothetical protein